MGKLRRREYHVTASTFDWGSRLEIVRTFAEAKQMARLLAATPGVLRDSVVVRVRYVKETP